MSEIKYYWSPNYYWETVGDALKANQHTFAGAAKFFPKFYFEAQKGVTAALLQEAFTEDVDEVKKLTADMIHERILVSGILGAHEVFKMQETFYDNAYGERIMYDAVAQHEFRQTALDRTHHALRPTKIVLQPTEELPAFITERRSVREFSRNEISFAKFSNLFSLLKQNRTEDRIYYNYPSAGGVYPIDIFIYIKDKRVESMKRGFYYYSPIDNSFTLVNNLDSVTEADHFFINKQIYREAAFSVFLVYNADASMPKYGSDAYYYACIEAGLISATFNAVAEMYGLGVTGIGEMAIKKVVKSMKLTDKQVLLHSLEVGLKPTL